MDYKSQFYLKYQNYIKVVDNQKFIYFIFVKDYNDVKNKLYIKLKDYISKGDNLLQIIVTYLSKHNKVYKLNLSKLDDSSHVYEDFIDSVTNNVIMILS